MSPSRRGGPTEAAAHVMVNAADILNARILVVDDQEANVTLLERMLFDAGYTAVSSTQTRSTFVATVSSAPAGTLATTSS